MSSKNTILICGTVYDLEAGDTKYGRRCQAIVDRDNPETGEPETISVIAWKDAASALEALGEGGEAGLRGTIKTTPEGPVLTAYEVAQMRHIDPATVDVSKYL